ncbi:hypothetical protein LX36DRAFT_245600 [Colletotrichum falcatum]|nr:hypothetical protein LX36DRAFT_245600 [Colletotrichum falcatum]
MPPQRPLMTTMYSVCMLASTARSCPSSVPRRPDGPEPLLTTLRMPVGHPKYCAVPLQTTWTTITDIFSSVRGRQIAPAPCISRDYLIVSCRCSAGKQAWATTHWPYVMRRDDGLADHTH